MIGVNIRVLIEESIPYKEQILANDEFFHVQYFESNHLRPILEATPYDILVIREEETQKEVISEYRENHLLNVILMNETATKTKYADFVVSTVEACRESLNHVVYCIKEIYLNKLFDIFAQLIKVRTIDSFNQVDHVKQITSIILEHLKRTNHPYVKSLTTSEMEAIVFFSGIHDLGKIMMSEELLTYTGIYNEKQREEMKQHTTLGANFFKQVFGKSPIKHVKIGENIILYHHERFDGKGYPSGLKGLDIPLETRIVSIADVYDALVSKRIYKAAIPHDEAVQIIKSSKGKQFDPEIVDMFLINESQIKKLKEEVLLNESS